MNQCPQSGNHAPRVDADASQAAECERIVAAKGAGDTVQQHSEQTRGRSGVGTRLMRIAALRNAKHSAGRD